MSKQQLAKLSQELTSFQNGLTYQNYAARYARLSPAAKKRVPHPSRIKGSAQRQQAPRTMGLSSGLNIF